MIKIGKLEELTDIFQYHKCLNPSIEKQYTSYNGSTITINHLYTGCNTKFKWEGSSRVEESRVFQVNLSSQISAQIAALSYPE